MTLRWSINSIAALLLMTGLWLLLQAHTAPPPPQDTMMIRKLDTASLPPPPPPPPSQPRPQETAAASLTLSQAKSPVKLKVTPLDMPLPELSAPNALSSEPVMESIRFDTQALVSAITTFSLDQLDEMPRLLTPITVRLPKTLRQQGIQDAQLRLHVLIHETGKVELVNVDQAQYPELSPLAQKIINQARFSSPRRQGNKVKAEFIWPLKVSA